MRIGILGRKSSGRSTFFDALTGQTTTPHGAAKLRMGLAKVIDPRIDKLSAMYEPKKTTYAEVTLCLPPPAPAGPVDIPSLRELRDLRAYVQLVAAYSGETDEQVVAEIDAFNTELVLNDMERVEKRHARILKGGGDRPGELAMLEKAGKCLEEEKPLRLLSWDEQEEVLLSEIGLLSWRCLLTVVNVDDGRLADGMADSIKEIIAQKGAEAMLLSATLEAEIATLDAEAQAEFLEAYGLTEPVSIRFVQQALAMLEQICFFTTGKDEVRAWPIARDTAARRASRTIHTDLEKGFIRAEVISYATLIEQGSEAACKSIGELRVEGKDYIVQDGDIINVRFNV